MHVRVDRRNSPSIVRSSALPLPLTPPFFPINTPHSIPLHTTRLPESMSPRPDTLGSSSSFILRFDGDDAEQEEQGSASVLAHEEGYEESEGSCCGGGGGHAPPESPNRYFSVRYPGGMDAAALLAAAGGSGSGSLLVSLCLSMWVCRMRVGDVDD